MTMIRITDETTTDELAEYLANLNAFAKRQQHLIEGSFEAPTEWTKAHRRMDAPLDDYLRAARAE